MQATIFAVLEFSNYHPQTRNCNLQFFRFLIMPNIPDLSTNSYIAKFGDLTSTYKQKAAAALSNYAAIPSAMCPPSPNLREGGREDSRTPIPRRTGGAD